MTRFEIFAPDFGQDKVRVGVVEARKDLDGPEAYRWAKQIALIFGSLYEEAWIECNVPGSNMTQREVQRICAGDKVRMMA